ncbi:MAG: 50S ribosomal protein L25/general stress protein Ctc [Gammaproteobacteria bacterium]|nr:50S ribosomal protein L25/general stress protein Ctc [Gammaproteobacteria bacterium]
MNEFEIIAEPRTALGKGATRRLRKSGAVPAIIYGGGEAPESLALARNVIRKQLENEAFYSTILTVTTPSGSQKAVLKALQRHPATNEVMHLDLQRASDTQVLHMNVPLHFINEDKAPGKRAGGMVQHAMIDVEVVCMAKDLPEYIEIDMGAMELGGTIHLSDLTLPEGVELTALTHGEDSQDLLVAGVVATRDESAGSAGEGEESEDGAESE